MRIISIAILLIIQFSGFSQNTAIDSLETEIKNYKIEDTTYVNLRLKLVSRKMFLTPADTNWLPHNFKTLEVSQRLEYKKGIALGNNNLGIIYHYFLSDPIAALDYYQASYAIIEEEPKFEKYIVGVVNNMALIHYEQQDFKKALPLFKRLLKFPQEKSNTLSNIGNIYGEQKQLDSAIYYFNAAIHEAKMNKNIIQIANIKSNLSLMLVAKGLLKEALKETEESLDLVKKHKLELIRVPVYVNAAEIYLQHQDLENAEIYATKSREFNASLNNLYTEKSALLTLANVNEYKGDYEKAYKFYKEHVILNDSLINVDRQVEISRKEIRYEADKKQALADAEASAEINRQRTIKNLSLAGGGGILMASLFAFVLFRKKQDAVSKRKEAEFNATVADVELKALRSQMNPHFIFNSLNSIGSYILKNDTQSASDYLTKFAKLMRLTLENSEKKEILLSEDIALLKTYLDIERKRFQNRFNYDIKISDTIDADNALIPPMILQPFIENSILHGFAHKNEQGIIKIDFDVKDEMLICSVDDNGTGRQQIIDTKPTKKPSFGMAITQSRIDIINKAKNTKGLLKIIDKKEGTRVEVLLPLAFAF